MTAFADLAQATAWVFDLQKFGIKFGLSSTLSLLARLRLDYQEGRYIHIAGTNGKGSVAAMLSAILSRAGYPVGMFTSPHLVSFSERFRLGDEEVSADRLLALINEVRAAVDDAEPPTFFEFATAMAFLYFLQAGAAPHYPGDRHGGPPGRHQHRPAAGFGDHQHFPGSPGTPGRGAFGHRRGKSGDHQARGAAGHLCPAKTGAPVVPQPLPGSGRPPLPGRGGLQNQGKIPGVFRLFRPAAAYPRADPQPQGPAPVRQCRGGPGGGGTAQPGRFPRARGRHPGGPGDSPLAGPPGGGPPGPPGPAGRGPQPRGRPDPGPEPENRPATTAASSW